MAVYGSSFMEESASMAVFHCRGAWKLWSQLACNNKLEE